jgi:hypothetical protein
MSHAVIQHMPIDTILTPYGSFTKTYNINNESDGTNGYLLAFPHYAPYVPDNLNLNNDSRLHYKTVHNYYRKFVDEWLGGKLRYLLGYLKYSNGEVKITKEHSESNETDNKKEKIKYIKSEICDVDRIEKILRKYVDRTGVDWYELHRHQSHIRKLIEIYIKNKFKKMVE